MNLSERVAYALISSARSPRDLAQEIGITVARISQLKSGTGGIKAENLFALARATGFSPQWLAEGAGLPKETEDEGPFSLLIRPLDDVKAAPNRGDAGTAECLVIDKKIIEGLDIDQRFLRYFVLTGLSLSPVLVHQDIAIVDTQQNKPADGQVFLMYRSDGAKVIRRLIQTLSDTWIARTEDSSKSVFPEETLSAHAASNLTIAGRIIWRGGRV